MSSSLSRTMSARDGKCRSFLFPDSMHLPAATVMSASPSIDAFDAQMLDFSSDPDVPMHITGSAEFFQEALMDHDDHLVVSGYGEHASVEVDMEEYSGDNAEYEMADETAEFNRLHGDDLLDIEVYDASHAHSPLAPPQPLQPSVDVPIDSEHLTSTSPVISEQTTVPAPDPESEVQPVPLDHLAADATHVEPSPSAADVSSEVVVSESAHPTEPLHEGISATSESHEQLGDGNGQPLEAPAPADVADEAEPHVPTAEEHPTHSEEARHKTSEPPVAESVRPAADTDDSGPPVQDEKPSDQAPETEGETADPRLLDGAHVDPPPAVLLSVADFSEPSFALFNQLVVEGEFTEETSSNQKVFSLLLENRPALYYEPLSNVFEALRQDEGLLSRVPHSFEGELVLDAYDLQLAVSEDNVHAREITLHDLNNLHDGSDFVGPLRLLLRAIVPRFIIRYYALQEQIQRLSVTAETGEGEHDDEQHQHYDLREDQLQPQQEEAADHPFSHVTIVSEGLEVPPTAEAEEPATEDSLPPTEETEQQEYETEDTAVAQEPAAEYHEVTGEAVLALEDEDDYLDTTAGEEDETARSASLVADQTHEAAAENIDASATVTGQESEFGGEQTEYLDYVQPEEYEERFGEERAGGASPVQYGEPGHYEEGEQDTLTAMDETRAILPGLDEDGDNKSVATPIPAHATLELEANELADVNSSSESVLPKQEGSISSNDESPTEQSLHRDAHRPSGNQETSIAQGKMFSETEESDFNLLSTLKREAEAEFERSFNSEQNGQGVSIEATLQTDETWDEWDDEDAEGEDEEDWIDPDAASNKSSVTLDSKASSKRSYDEVEPSEEPYAENQNSPGKRPRVQ
ncbi:hypothetical protein JVU11DRAFT_189 [Chiua virens]|nr:hypothetical protein JVU11DRAFT_189 [Chiua virens]